MTELEDFLAPTLARQMDAELALVSGDAGPRLDMTSLEDPVTVFGAKVPIRSGWDEVSETLRWLAACWSDCTDYRFDLVAAVCTDDGLDSRDAGGLSRSNARPDLAALLPNLTGAWRHVPGRR